MSGLYPLTFRPIFKELVWGGTRLAQVLGKPFPLDKRIGESWELVDLPGAQSVVDRGPLAGETLASLVASHGPALLGPVATDGGRFPLLVKYIDATQTLSVQVHPDAACAQRLGGRPKSEAWYILATEEGTSLFIGLKPGTSAPEFARAVEEDRVADLLEKVAPKVGDLFPVRPGTVHAIGAGALLAEVQQPSDTTYRLYDWGRVGLDGRPRPLHLSESMASIDFGAERINARSAYDCPQFQIRVVDARQGSLDVSGAAQGPLVIVGLAGSGAVSDAAREKVALGPGQVVLLPHACRPARLEGADLRAMLVTFPAAAVPGPSAGSR